MKHTRRHFLKQSTLAGSAMILPLSGIAGNLFKENTSELPKVFLFSKHLQFLDYNAMSEATAEMGFNGLDLTVRPKGHVSPEKVVDELPKAVEAMQKNDLLPQMMTTNILDAEKKETLSVLKTAGSLGLTHYRTGWLTYPEDRTITESQAIFGQQFKELEILNKKYGLIGCYQNHAGNHVGAPIWDLPPILSHTQNEYMGCQYDIRHAVVEGGSCWELGLRHIRPYIKTIVIKDFKWGNVNGKWKPINTPLGEGMVNFDLYFSLLKKYKINVPISLHLEYDLGGAEKGASEISIPQKEVFQQMKKDLTFLKEAWQKAK
ncbi:TIM barrel protein [Maribacter polysiphoniae]|uniref:Secreted protein n=1 Tax=Maribacter polysiphoniae TaxID=429344 RepID=A0A316E5V1_9FLAO|nr:TIM barrel protein [Maribacter polysiphoniae]MBD1262377.1 TIM barrel protein [Maribacter polysiphoniae]PWK26077.1 secreted protein [Maribacter polysiphoniae]